MYFVIKKEKLLDKLNIVSKAVSTKNLIPALAGIKFDLNDEGLSLTATDNDITIKSVIMTQDIENIKENGSVVLPGRYILEIIRKCPNEDITFEQIDNNKVLISTSNYKTNLNGIEINDYPNIDFNLSDNYTTLNSKVLRNLINQTSFAVSISEARPIITGVNFKMEDNMLEVTATDSHRLSTKTVELSSSINNPVNITIPGRNINELRSILEEDNDVKVYFFDNKVVFIFNNIIFQSRILNGNYPNTAKLIPTEFELAVKVNLRSLYDAVDRISLLSSDYKIRVSIVGEVLTVSSTVIEVGNGEEKINIERNNPVNIEFTVNYKFLTDALKIIEDDNIVIYLNGEDKPIIIKGEVDTRLIELLLPILTN